LSTCRPVRVPVAAIAAIRLTEFMEYRRAWGEASLWLDVRRLNDLTLGPASAGPFLVSKHLGTISRVPGFALVRKRDDLPQHDETQASLRRGFFCTERSWACFQGWDPHCRCGNLGPYSRRHADQSITRRSASGFCGPAQRRHSAIRRSSPSKKWIALHIR